MEQEWAAYSFNYPLVIAVGLQPVALLKKDCRKNCFHVNFSTFFRTAYLKNTYGNFLYKVQV